jgi:hypothetical protein
MGNDAQRRRKYIFTAQLDDRIREIYLSHSGTKTRPGIKQLSERVGIPHWTLKKRARELGLARTKEKPWGEAELAILGRYAWMSDERIRLKLKAAGYPRSNSNPFEAETHAIQIRSEFLFSERLG